MGIPEMFVDAPADTRTDIMRATYVALTKHGYADLTIQRIADEFDKSKSLLYHHYDGKEAILLDFLGFLTDRFEAETEATSDDDPHHRLVEFFDRLLPARAPEGRCEFDRVYVELRAAGAHDVAFREKFTETDHVMRDQLADIIQEGMDVGAFDEDDSTKVASFLLATTLGTIMGRATSNDQWAEDIRAELDAHIDARLGLGETASKTPSD